MKKRAILLWIPVMALSIGACKKKEETKAPVAPVAVETPAPETIPAVPVKATVLSPDERGAKLGFVKYLPQDTEVVMAFHNGSKSAQRIQSSKLWKLVQAQMGMGMEIPEDPGVLEDMDEEAIAPEAEQDATANAGDATANEEPMGPAALFGTEFTIALGTSAGEQTANLLTLNRRMSYFQTRTLAKAAVDAAKSGNFTSLESKISSSYGPEFVKELLADPESGVALFEKMRMPPLCLAFRTPESGRDAAAQEIASLTANLAMFGDMVEPIEVEKAGQKFSGHKISGEKISESLAGSRKEMEEMLDPAAVDRLLAAVAKKDLVVLSGTLGDYIVLFIGSSVDDLNFAPDINHSLVASDALAFCDAYASKELAAVIYGRKNTLDQITAAAGGIADAAAGIRDGLSGSEGLGDTRDLETLLRMVADREAALRQLAGNEALGTAAFFEDGLKIESFGGTDNGMVDWKTTNKLASLGDSENVVMFANMTTEAAYDKKARAYMEALMETSYAAAMKVSGLPFEGEEFVQFKQTAKIFDTKFRPDAVAIWDAFSDSFSGGLGSERAWIIDLKGSVPAIPGIPQAVVDQGKFPRISIVAPVTDRTKLTASWDKMNTSLTSILTKVGEMKGQHLPMQKPVSSEKNAYTTWFFPMPFFNDDFMPSVTVGDQWFAASTSKNQALDLVNQAAAATETRTGCWFSMNFKVLEKYSRETIRVLDNNSEALRLPKAVIKEAAVFVGALEDLDKLTVHARREGGVLRSSVHLKTR